MAQALASLSQLSAAIEIHVSEQLPRVLADAGLLERVVANVVSNALRYSPEDRPLRIEAGQVGDRVHLRIIDQGPGVRPDDRDRIFEPFQRLGGSGHVHRCGAGPGRGPGLHRRHGRRADPGGHPRRRLDHGDLAAKPARFRLARAIAEQLAQTDQTTEAPGAMVTRAGTT